jgi:hypothetical protein
MDHAKKLEFVKHMTKMGLDHVKHFDTGGGVVSAGSSGAGPLGGISAGLTAQNGFQASAPTSAGAVGTQQAGLAGQLQTEAAGGGPNPAQIQLQQNAAQIAQAGANTNSANRALNPGLAARMSGNQTEATTTNAAGTAASQQAQQQLAAQSQLEGLTGQEQTGALQAQGINAQVAQNNTNAVENTQGGILGGVGSAISSLTGLAKGGEVKRMASGGSIQVPGVVNLSNAGALPDFSQSGGGSDPEAPTDTSPGEIAAPENNYATAANDFGSNSTPESVQNFGAQPLSSSTMGSQFSGNPSAPHLSKGGKVGPQSHVGKFLNAKKMASGGLMGEVSQIAPLVMMAANKGGKVPAMVSPGEKYLNPKEAKAVAQGKADPMKVGKTVPGKPKVMHDSLKNDTVPAMLDDGGEVIPLHVMIKRSPEKAAAFVRKHLSKKSMSIS